MADPINALAPVNTLPSESEWNTMASMAQQLVPTGFLPKAVDTPQKAVAIVLKGRELGIPPMYALSNITVIQGKPTANAELMLALVKRAYGRDVIWVEKSTPAVAAIGYLVHGKPKFYEFTIDMAQKAGLMSNPTWNKYPDAMLRARAISAVCRMEFPEVIGGMYVPGELGEPVRIDEQTGEVTSVDYEIPAPSALASPQRPDRETAMRRLHAVAAEQGITHDDLHRWALDRDKTSLTEMNTASLITMADKLDKDTDRALAYFDQLRVAAEQRAELEQLNEQLNAQIDGEIVDEDGVIHQGELVAADVKRPGYGDA